MVADQWREAGGLYEPHDELARRWELDLERHLDDVFGCEACGAEMTLEDRRIGQRERDRDEKVKWGTLGDAPSVAVKPELVKTMKNAGCSYISFGFESASNKVLNEDIQKGQTQEHLQKTIYAVKDAGLTRHQASP